MVTDADILTQIIEVVTNNSPIVIYSAITLASFNFIIGWFMHVIGGLSKAYK